jgi:hypothetical protein
MMGQGAGMRWRCGSCGAIHGRCSFGQHFCNSVGLHLWLIQLLGSWLLCSPPVPDILRIGVEAAVTAG